MAHSWGFFQLQYNRTVWRRFALESKLYGQRGAISGGTRRKGAFHHVPDLAWNIRPCSYGLRNWKKLLPFPLGMITLSLPSALLTALVTNPTWWIRGGKFCASD
jgi:hypothetical protein